MNKLGHSSSRDGIICSDLLGRQARVSIYLRNIPSNDYCTSRSFKDNYGKVRELAVVWVGLQLQLWSFQDEVADWGVDIDVIPLEHCITTMISCCRIWHHRLSQLQLLSFIVSYR